MPTNPEAPPQIVPVAVYTRVSREEQARERYSLDTQRQACLAKLDEVYGKDLYEAHFFADEGVPGRYGLYDPANPKRKFRPGLTHMRDAFKAGELDVLCIYRMNRLWRKAAAGDFLLEHFVPHGLQRILSCWENVDFKTASGRFQLNVAAAMGAFEAEQLGEVISDSKQHRTRDGYPNGIPYGWRSTRWDPDRKEKRPGIAPDPQQAEIVRQVSERYLAEGTIRAVVAWLNSTGTPTPGGGKEWGMDGVRRILGCPIHAGLIGTTDESGSPKYIQGAHWERRLYEPDTFYQIRDRLARGAAQTPRSVAAAEYLLGGLLVCGHCGCRMNGRRGSHSPTRYYRCARGSMQSRPNCTRNQTRADWIEAVIVGELRELARDAAVQQRAHSDVETMLLRDKQSIDRDIEILTKRLAKLWDDYRYWAQEFRDGRCEADEFALHRDSFRDQKSGAEAELGRLTERRSSDEAQRAVLLRAQQLISDFEASWDGLTPAQKRETIHSIVESASLTWRPDGHFEVSFTIRGLPPVTRLLQRRRASGRPSSGPGSLRPAEQACLYLFGQGLSPQAIARQRGIVTATVRDTLHRAKRKLGASSLQQAWETAREHIESNLPVLPLKGREYRRKAPDRLAPILTRSQCELLSKLAEGLDTRSAARGLGISANTAYVQLSNCRERLGVGTTQEAIRKAQELGLLGATAA